MLAVTDGRVQSFSGITHAVAGVLEAARAHADLDIALRTPLVVGGSAVLTRLGSPVSDVDLDLALFWSPPETMAFPEARAKMLDAVAAFYAAIPAAIATQPQLDFVSVSLVREGHPAFEWSGPDADSLRPVLEHSDVESVLLVAGAGDDVELIDIRVNRAFRARGGASSFIVRLNSYWFGHVAFTRDDADRYAAFERSAARQLAGAYDDVRSYADAVDGYVRAQAATGRWLKVAKVLPQRTAWLGEDATREHVARLVSSPAAHASAHTSRAMTAIQLAQRKVIEPEQAVRMCITELNAARASMGDLTTPEDTRTIDGAASAAPTDALREAVAIIDRWTGRFDEAARVHMAELLDLRQ